MRQGHHLHLSSAAELAGSRTRLGARAALALGLVAVVAAGCATAPEPRDRELTALREEVARLQAAREAPPAIAHGQQAAPTPHSEPEPPASPHPLPVVKLEPPRPAQTGAMPVARALLDDAPPWSVQEPEVIVLPHEGLSELESLGIPAAGGASAPPPSAPPSEPPPRAAEATRRPASPAARSVHLDAGDGEELVEWDSLEVAEARAGRGPAPLSAEPALEDEPLAPPEPPVPALTSGAPSSPVVPVTEETAPGPDALYQQALDALRAKQYSAARAGFEQVFQRAPEHHLSDNALYWLGEVEYDQKRFDLAAPAFERVMRDTPQGNKVPDAKVKLALCLLQLGQADKARILLREVAANYPGTEAAKVAAERLPAM